MLSRFATLAQTVEITGVGLHCGQTIRARLCSSEQLGVHFVRTDLAGAPQVSADIACVTATTHATTLESGAARVQTIEHLLAALWTQGFTHVRVELNGPEVPILDGSSLPWIELLRSAGRRELRGERPWARFVGPAWSEDGSAQMLGLPLEGDALRLSVAVNFDVPGALAQTFDGLVDAATFARELAPARTFTLERWLEPLRTAGLIRGGSLESAVVIGDDGSASSPPRMEGELARHKALDVLGDVALALCPSGARLSGHIVAIRAGHGLHRAFAARALQSKALRFQSSMLDFSTLDSSTEPAAK